MARKPGVLRKCVQAGWGILTNAYVQGFLPGGPSIYKGDLKKICVPGMNCYSCPGALGSCPIGSMQAVFDARQRKFAFYVVGYLALIGLLVGRFVCGWLCLFGLIQELLYKIPTPKLKIPDKIDKPLRYLKYAVLFVMVFALPFFVRSELGVGEPFFCKYICPVGTLEGGIPLVLLNDAMRAGLGWLFRWKFLLLIICILSSVFIYRPFCKYICPLGAFYGLFQKVSLVKMHVDESACVNCGLCAKTCKMNVNPCKTPNSAECIRCRECINACPKNALSMGIRDKNVSGGKVLPVIGMVLLVMCLSFVFINYSNKDSEITGSDSTYYCKGAGFGFDLPENMNFSKGFVDVTDLGDLDYDSGVMVGWPVYYDMSRDEYAASIEQGSGQLHAGHSFTIVCVEDVDSEEAAKDKMIATLEKMYGTVSEEDRQSVLLFKMIHRENGYVWMAKDDPRSDDIRKESMEEYDAFYDATDEIISSLKYYTPKVWTGTEEGTDLSFETMDLNGNPVTSEALFSQNKVTMINIWATTCGPCIEEMPELEELNKEFQAKGGAIIGVVDDVWLNNTKYLDEAQSVVKDTGVTYTNLCAWEGYDDVLELVGTPTTYFVDSRGKIIGNPILGAHPAEYKERMEEYLESAE